MRCLAILLVVLCCGCMIKDGHVLGMKNVGDEWMDSRVDRGMRRHESKYHKPLEESTAKIWWFDEDGKLQVSTAGLLAFMGLIERLRVKL